MRWLELIPENCWQENRGSTDFCCRKWMGSHKNCRFPESDPGNWWGDEGSVGYWCSDTSLEALRSRDRTGRKGDLIKTGRKSQRIFCNFQKFAKNQISEISKRHLC